MLPREKIGRRALARKLAVAATAAAAVSEAPAQSPAADAELRAARQDQMQAARAIAQVPLPGTTEPAFRFKA
jgi:hypothetical protein